MRSETGLRRRQLVLVSGLVAIGLVVVTIGIGAVPVPVGDSDADPATGENQIDRAIDDAVGDQLRERGVGGVAGETRIGTVRSYEDPSDEVQFVVEADRRAYWRTGAYDVYSGVGWYRSTEQAPDHGPVSGDRRTGETLTAEVEIETATTRVPTPWRPTAVSSEATSLSFDNQDGVVADQRLESGDTVRVQSDRPLHRPDRLRQAGRNYPDAVERQYTPLPDDVPDRVHERTARITADAETPYEQAIAIRDWLRTNRGYTLEVPPPEDDVTDELLFERQRAHCAYFATAMATMLRIEDVPTRYVVGYTSGDEIGSNRYVVRDANAHAWVEVYFPEIGWVPFDPTPASERSAAVADALDDIDDDEFDGAAAFDPTPAVDGDGTPPSSSGGDGSTPGTDADEDEQSTDDGTDEDEQSTDDGTDEDEQSTDDGTDEDEQSTDDGTDEDEQSTDDGTDENEQDDGEGIEIRPLTDPRPGEKFLVVVVDEEASSQEDVRVRFGDDPVGPTNERGIAAGTLPFARTVTITAREQSTPSSAPPDARITVDVITDVAVETVDAAKPNESVDVTARLGEEPLPNATVLVDGEPRTETDEDGTAMVSLPAEPNRSVDVGVERGSVTETTTVDIDPVAVSIESPTVILPGRSMTVLVEANGTPIEGVDVTAGNETATTGPAGTAQLPVPATTTATVAVRSGDSDASTTVGPLVNLGVGGVVVVLAGGIVVVAVGGLPEFGRQRGLIGRLIAVSVRIERRLRGVRPGLYDRLDRTTGSLSTITAWVRSLLGRPPRLPSIDGRSPREAVDRAWIGLVRVAPGDHRTRTPRGIVELAVRSGFPRGPCERILTAYRRVRYGGHTPTGDWIDRLRTALDELRQPGNER